MFGSLTGWLNVPYSYKPFIKRNGAGTKQYGDAVSSMCYPAGELEVITDKDGAKIISNTQLYVKGSEAIGLLDLVVFNNEERPIKSISSFYRNGVEDIKVVYL